MKQRVNWCQLLGGTSAKKRAALTVFVQEIVLHVLAEEVLYGLADLLLLLQDVLVILSVVPLGDGWVQRHTASSTAKTDFHKCTSNKTIDCRRGPKIILHSKMCDGSAFC